MSSNKGGATAPPTPNINRLETTALEARVLRALAFGAPASEIDAARAAVHELAAHAQGMEDARDTLLREIQEDYVLAGAYHEQRARAEAAEADRDRLRPNWTRSDAGWPLGHHDEVA